MKIIVLYSVLFLLLTNCKAQHNPQQTVTKKTFDIENFEKNKSHLNEYMFYENNGVKVFQKKRHSEFKETISYPDSYIQTINRYYLSGKFKSTVKCYPNRFLSGVMKEYDEQGHLIKETDYDAPYKFTWEDILAFIKKRNIDMNAYGFEVSRGFGFGSENIGEETEKPFWAITYIR